MPDYIRLDTPPTWCIQYPTCSACDIELETDGDGWLCPCCGTSWDLRAGDGDRGTLYADWAGEQPDGPDVPESDAWRWGSYHRAYGNHQNWPDLCPKPKRPTNADPWGANADA